MYTCFVCVRGGCLCVSLPSSMEELSIVDSNHLPINPKIFIPSFFFLENIHQSYPQPCLTGSEKLPIKSPFMSNSLFSVKVPL